MPIEALRRDHERAGFSCGVASLDDYLKRFARQNDEKGISRAFVFVGQDATTSASETRIRGYYTLSASTVRFENLPERALPHYPIPTALLGRLAVDQAFQGQKLGAFLLLDALRRVELVAQTLGLFAIEVVALDDAARSFYLKFGFAPMHDDALHLYLPLSKVRQMSG